MSPLDYRTRHTAAQTLAMATSAILLFDRNATDPAVPTCRMPSQRAQGRSSKAEGLRVSGLCLTEPRTLAISVWVGESITRAVSVTPAVCPNYWWQNSTCYPNEARPGGEPDQAAQKPTGFRPYQLVLLIRCRPG
jgi:hypothetical protein